MVLHILEAEVEESKMFVMNVVLIMAAMEVGIMEDKGELVVVSMGGLIQNKTIRKTDLPLKGNQCDSVLLVVRLGHTFSIVKTPVRKEWWSFTFNAQSLLFRFVPFSCQ